ncbi:MAG: DedA family protein [Microbacteriaceae bacterium]|nr:DedA family protein [Microbacteriaceae bacterium]
MFGITWLDPHALIASYGNLAVFIACAIVFIETGLLAGFFLPGDSLLFVIGVFLASPQAPMPLWLACLLIAASAWLGDQTGYWIGSRLGPAVFNRPNSRFFSKKNVEAANSFFEKHGSKAVILAHFVPIMRTFVPVAAGVGQMEYSRFLRFNIIGVVGWGAGVTALGYFLGGINFVQEHVEWVTIAFIVLSTIPILTEVVKARREKRSEK